MILKRLGLLGFVAMGLWVTSCSHKSDTATTTMVAPEQAVTEAPTPAVEPTPSPVEEKAAPAKKSKTKAKVGKQSISHVAKASTPVAPPPAAVVSPAEEVALATPAVTPDPEIPATDKVVQADASGSGHFFSKYGIAIACGLGGLAFFFFLFKRRSQN